jgi:hypothetical protein
MFQLVGVRLFETEDLAALRIDPGHDVPNGTVLACSIDPLKNQQQRIAFVRVSAASLTLECILQGALDTAPSTCKRASQSSATL